MTINTPNPEGQFPPGGPFPPNPHQNPPQQAGQKTKVTMSLPVLALFTFALVAITGLVASLVTAAVVKEDTSSRSSSNVADATNSEAVYGNNTTTTTTTSASAVYGLNQPITNGDVKFTLISAESPATITKYDASDGSSGYVSVSPKPNAKFILLHANVENIGRTPENRLYIAAVVLSDQQDRLFNTIHENYAIQQNFDREERNDELQPGFSDEVWFLYEVPKAAQIEYVALTEGDSRGNGESYDIIRLPKAL